MASTDNTVLTTVRYFITYHLLIKKKLLHTINRAINTSTIEYFVYVTMYHTVYRSKYNNIDTNIDVNGNGISQLPLD